MNKKLKLEIDPWTQAMLDPELERACCPDPKTHGPNHVHVLRLYCAHCNTRSLFVDYRLGIVCCKCSVCEHVLGLFQVAE